MSPFITLTGQSNRDYVFTVLPLNRNLPEAAGMYVVTNTVFDQADDILHHPLLIGTCDNLSELSGESKIQQLRNSGKIMICVKTEEVTENRQQIEQDLKAKYSC